jgi:hypothetical protein
MNTEILYNLIIKDNHYTLTVYLILQWLVDFIDNLILKSNLFKNLINK